VREGRLVSRGGGGEYEGVYVDDYDHLHEHEHEHEHERG
jgi:hypothetical protein